MSQSISVIIPTYYKNPHRELLRCIESVRPQLKLTDELIVIINGNDEAEETHTQDGIVHYYTYKNPFKTSYAARNFGVKKAKGDILAFIDDDAWADARWLEEIRFSFLNPKLDFVGGYTDYGLETPVSWLRFITCNIAYRCKVFDRNLFDEKVKSGGDVDFADLLKSLGHKGVHNLDIKVTHPTGYFETIRKEFRYGSGYTLEWMVNDFPSYVIKPVQHWLREWTKYMSKTVGFIYFKVTGKTHG